MLDEVINALSNPAAYPQSVDEVEVHHTHISVVFLAGPFAYKIKKPVNLGFLDFSTLEKRRHFCEREVKLNRRLAPHVYHGVVPVTSHARELAIEGQGEVVEWVVKMDRLPENATLLDRLQRGEVDVPLIERLASKIVSFHTAAEAGPHIASFGQFDVVARNARENFTQAAPQVGVTLSAAVFETLRHLTEEHLKRLRPTLDSRAERGCPRDTHGDLHLDHVYLFPDRNPPDDLVIIDCIEFNERFRYADPIADMAFLVMDLLFHGRPDLAHAFGDTYFRWSGDEEGRRLLPFYTAYRAAVRGKVEGFELTEREVPEAERLAALQRARGHWLLAVGQLEETAGRPCLVLIAGLPGTGKSTLAQGLAEYAGFQVLRSDAIRKQQAGLQPATPTPAALRERLYSTESTRRTYAEALRQAEQLLFEGNRVIVDANFPEEATRLAFFNLARRYCVPALLFQCTSSPDAIRSRLAQRQNDVSDADWATYRLLESRWEALGEITRRYSYLIAGDGESPRSQAGDILRRAGLMS